MDHKLKYGRGQLFLTINPLSSSWVSRFSEPEYDTDPGELVEDKIISSAINNPIKSPKLSEIAQPGEKICIVTSDNTRPMPTSRVLPLIIEELKSAGISKKDITVVFALGIHRKQTEEERNSLLNEDGCANVRAVDSDPQDTVYLGSTPRGTPVNVFSEIHNANRIVCMGNVEFHYFAGFSGGYKAILPGVCNLQTVTHNHRLMTKPEARTGKLDGNPVREDIDSVGRLINVDFIINVALDSNRRVIFAAAGHPIDAHREVCSFIKRTKGIPAKFPGDLVIASAGGHPKDINLYQAQKALDSAAQFAKEGAPIVLVAACPEGHGNDTFTRWLINSQVPDDIKCRLSNNFELGGHKAYAIANVAKRHPIGLTSEIPDDKVRQAFMRPVPVSKDGEVKLPSEFMKKAQGMANGNPHIIILPEAASVFPLFQN